MSVDTEDALLSSNEQIELLDASIILLRDTTATTRGLRILLQLVARLTRSLSLAKRFVDRGGIIILLSLTSPSNASASIGQRSFARDNDPAVMSSSLFDILHHCVHDDVSLRIAMQKEIMDGLRTIDRKNPNMGVALRDFITMMAPVARRDHSLFRQAVDNVAIMEYVTTSSSSAAERRNGSKTTLIRVRIKPHLRTAAAASTASVGPNNSNSHNDGKKSLQSSMEEVKESKSGQVQVGDEQKEKEHKSSSSSGIGIGIGTGTSGSGTVTRPLLLLKGEESMLLTDTCRHFLSTLLRLSLIHI